LEASRIEIEMLPDLERLFKVRKLDRRHSQRRYELTVNHAEEFTMVGIALANNRRAATATV